jgi:hypothetical protein
MGISKRQRQPSRNRAAARNSSNSKCRPLNTPTPRFELINLILSGSLLKRHQDKSRLLFRFAVRDTLTGNVHQHLLGWVDNGPTIVFGQVKESRTSPSFESPSSVVKEPALAETNFTTDDIGWIMDQLLDQLTPICNLLTSTIPPLDLGRQGGGLALIEGASTKTVQLCQRNSPECAAVVWAVEPLEETE